MEKVSEVKSAADEAKGAVLEEISRTVEDINAAIKERKGRLAPQVKALREARQQLQVRAGAAAGTAGDMCKSTAVLHRSTTGQGCACNALHQGIHAG